MLIDNQGFWLLQAHDHSEELRRAVEVDRLLRHRRQAKARWLDRLSTRLGALLVAAGTRLQERQATGYTPAPRQSF